MKDNSITGMYCGTVWRKAVGSGCPQGKKVPYMVAWLVLRHGCFAYEPSRQLQAQGKKKWRSCLGGVCCCETVNPDKK